MTSSALREAVERVMELAENDPEAAAVVREKIRPDLAYYSERLRDQGAAAVVATECVDPELAAGYLCEAAETLPENIARLTRKFERAVGARAPRRKALWKQTQKA